MQADADVRVAFPQKTVEPLLKTLSSHGVYSPFPQCFSDLHFDGAGQPARSRVAPSLTAQRVDLERKTGGVAFDAVPFGAVLLMCQSIVREFTRAPTDRRHVLDAKRACLACACKLLLKKRHRVSARRNVRGYYHSIESR